MSFSLPEDGIQTRRTRSGAAHDSYLAQRHFASLDGLRCLCILAVMWHHSPAKGMLGEGAQILGRGFVGVDFFFVLSGFLITTLLLREEAQNGVISIRAFYWRRALRILPVYLLLVTVVSAYWILVKGQVGLAGLVPYYYGFLANFLKGDIAFLSITWSLSVEEQYYLIWPALLTILPLAMRWRLGVLAVLIGVCLLIMMGLADWLGLPVLETEHARFALPGMSYMAILMGAALAVALHHKAGYRAMARLCAFPGAPVAMLALLLVWLQVSPVVLTGWPALVMDALMTLSLASLVIREDHALRPVMAFRPIARIGEISYGVYLYHLIGLHLAHEIVAASGVFPVSQPAGAWLVTALFPAIAIAMAELSFRTYERYFLSLKSLYPGKARP